MENMTIRWLTLNVMAAPMTLRYVLGEVRELAVEVAKLDIEGMREEASDVAICGQLWLFEVFGRRLDWKVRAGRLSAYKYTARRRTWRRIFEEHGLLFENRYLANGGNYAKPHKVAMALDMAREEQGVA